MTTDWDDIAERVTERYETQLDLTDIFTEDDLENSLKKLPSGKYNQNNRTLINNAGKLFDTRTIEIHVINNIDRLSDFDMIRNIINQGSPTFRLSARQRGIEHAKQQLRGKSIEEYPPDAIDFLRDYSPQTLGGFVTQEGKRLSDVL